MSDNDTPRCERCNTRVPHGGSLQLYRFRWSCDGCREPALVTPSGEDPPITARDLRPRLVDRS